MLQEAILLSDIFIHLPVEQLPARLATFIKKGWQPELALQSRDLDQLEAASIAALKQDLAASRLRSSIHAPFLDLNPAATDLDIRRITERRFRQTISFAAQINASCVVFHPGFDPWRYARTPDAWLNNSLEFWPPLLELAADNDLILCLENIFDTQPNPLVDLLNAIDSPQLRHCFDIGHWFLFSKTPLDRWFDLLGPYLSHLHLHDNRGRRDDHRPIGAGKIDFDAFFSQLQQSNLYPTATLEAHNLQDAEQSLAALQALLDS